MNSRVRTIGLMLLGFGAAAGLAALVLRDQVSRHRRDLFSPSPLQRLAALGHLAGEPASVCSVTLLRDFREWEERPMLQRRAGSILARMEDELLREEVELLQEKGRLEARELREAYDA